MIYVFVWLSQKEYSFVQVAQCEQRLNCYKCYVHNALKCPWRVSQSKWHAFEPVQDVMQRQCCLYLVFFEVLDLQITAIGVYRR